MILDIDKTYCVRAEGFRWTLRSKTGTFASLDGSRRVGSTDYAKLAHLADALIRRQLIEPAAAQRATAVEQEARAVAQQLSQQGITGGSEVLITFGGGRFTLKAGCGDWILSNTSREVSCVPGKGSVVGYCPSIRSALQLAVERMVQAMHRTLPYTSVDQVLLATAHQLWADVHLTRSVQKGLCAA